VPAADGAVLTRVTAPPTLVNTYSCNETTGVYTFNSSTMSNVAVLVSYQHTDAANGKVITMTNTLLGVAPTFLAAFTAQKTVQGATKKLTMVLNSCTSSQLTIAHKLEDYAIPGFAFKAMADASGNIGTISLSE
jgi:hypothetical protein